MAFSPIEEIVLRTVVRDAMRARCKKCAARDSTIDPTKHDASCDYVLWLNSLTNESVGGTPTKTQVASVTAATPLTPLT